MGRLLILPNLQANIWIHDELRGGLPDQDQKMDPPMTNHTHQIRIACSTGKETSSTRKTSRTSFIRYWGRCDHCCYQLILLYVYAGSWNLDRCSSPRLWDTQASSTPSSLKVDQLSTLLSIISPTLDNALIYDSLRDRAEMGKFKSSIGSTNGTTSQFLVDDDTEATEPSTDNDFSVNSTDILDDLYAKATKGNIYLDDIMVSASHSSRSKGIDASHLSKIWRIYLDSEKWTLEVMSKHITRRYNPTLSRNFWTKYHMLRYKRIK